MLEAEDVAMNWTVIDMPFLTWKQTQEPDQCSQGMGPRIASTVCWPLSSSGAFASLVPQLHGLLVWGWAPTGPCGDSRS